MWHLTRRLHANAAMASWFQSRVIRAASVSRIVRVNETIANEMSLSNERREQRRLDLRQALRVFRGWIVFCVHSFVLGSGSSSRVVHRNDNPECDWRRLLRTWPSRQSQVGGQGRFLMRNSNKITGANAGGLRLLAIRSRWSARFAQFRR